MLVVEVLAGLVLAVRTAHHSVYEALCLHGCPHEGPVAGPRALLAAFLQLGGGRGLGFVVRMCIVVKMMKSSF